MRFIKLLLFVIGLSFSLSSLAQDTIVLKSGEQFITKIITIDPDFVTYKLASDLDGPTITTRKSEIKTVALKSGSVLKFKNTQQSDNFTPTYASEMLDAKKNSIKWEMLSLLTNDLCFGYERMIGNKCSAEIKLAVIGIGNRNVESYYNSGSTSGYFIKLGVKAITSRSGNPKSLIGFYVKPEICYTSFKSEGIDFKSKYAMINFGKTFQIVKNFSIDFYGGIGACYNDFQEVLYTYSSSFFGGSNSTLVNRSYFYSNTTLNYARNHELTTCLSGGFVLAYNF